jgi:orotate phosphoribosyltransferase
MGKFNQSDFNKFIIDNNIIGFFEDAITLKSGRKSNYYINWRNVANDAYSLDKLSDFVLDFASDLGIETDCFFGVPEGATKLGLITQYKANPTGNILTNNFKSVPIEWIDKKVDEYIKFLDPDDDLILGSPFGEVSRELAVITQYKLAKQSEDFSKDKFIIPYQRKKAKGTHGDVKGTKDQNFVGVPNKRVKVLIEHGNSPLNYYENLKALGVEVKDITFVGDIPYAKNPDSLAVLEDVTTTGGSLINILDELTQKGIKPKYCIGASNRCELRDDGYSVRETIENMGLKYEEMSKSTDLLPVAYQKNKPSPVVVEALEKQFKKYGVNELKLI